MARYPDYDEFLKGPAPQAPTHTDYVRTYIAEDASLHVLEADGTDTEVGAGGGGSQPVLVTANGLVKDYSPPAQTILFDPRAQAWIAEHTYSCNVYGLDDAPAYVCPTSNPAIKFEAIKAQSGLSGSDEPEWPEEGSQTVSDGELIWGSFVQPLKNDGWESEYEIPGAGIVIVAGGFLWGAAEGTTGVEEPDWASAPERDDEIVDGTVTWGNQGQAFTWEAETRYYNRIKPDHSDYYPDWVIPTVPAGFAFSLTGVNKRFVASGPDEPEWGEAESGDGTYWTDGEICWEEATSDSERLLVTGIEAPSGQSALSLISAVPRDSSCSVTLLDQGYVSSFGDEAVSDEDNRLDLDGSDIELGVAAKTDLAYIDSRWLSLGTP